MVFLLAGVGGVNVEAQRCDEEADGESGVRAERSTSLKDEDASRALRGAEAVRDHDKRPGSIGERALDQRSWAGFRQQVASSRITRGAGATYARTNVTNWASSLSARTGES